MNSGEFWWIRVNEIYCPILFRRWGYETNVKSFRKIHLNSPKFTKILGWNFWMKPLSLSSFLSLLWTISFSLFLVHTYISLSKSSPVVNAKQCKHITVVNLLVIYTKQFRWHGSPWKRYFHCIVLHAFATKIFTIWWNNPDPYVMETVHNEHKEKSNDEFCLWQNYRRSNAEIKCLHRTMENRNKMMEKKFE